MKVISSSLPSSKVTTAVTKSNKKSPKSKFSFINLINNSLKDKLLLKKKEEEEEEDIYKICTL